MHLNSITDQFVFRMMKSELDTRLYEVTYAEREKIEEVEGNILNFGDLNPYVKEFITTFYKSFTKEQTKAMLSRIKTLIITEKKGTKNKFSTYISLGMYDSDTNSITLEYYDDKAIPINIKSTLSHELLHMASTRNTQVGTITGLEIPNLLGENFNEGCTEYFTAKYFTKEDYTISEDSRILIVKGIENIVGRETLEECYFEANFGKLIKALEPYSDKDNLLKLFYTIDHIDDPFSSRKNYRSIIQEIARMNHRRLVQLKAEGKMSQEEYDIEHAIKVDEYRYYQIWSEDTEVLKDGQCFILKNRERQSELYDFTPEEKNPQFEKKYQE